jgi:hypothetical protein
MDIFYDTEFIEDGNTIDLISIGMVSERGELYLESNEFDRAKAESNPWLVENVLSNLKGGDYSVDRLQIKQRVRNFIGSHFAPELWAWFGAYDHVAYAQLFGKMITLPDGMPQYTNELVTLMKLKGVSRDSLPEQQGTEHHALEDARWNQEAYWYITSRK